LDLLAEVIRRHPYASFLPDVSRKAEGHQMGWTHLVMLGDDSQFEKFCIEYARRGARRGLVLTAEELGSAIPAIALLWVGAVEVATEAAARALETNADCGVIEYMAAVVGHEFDPILTRVITHLHDPIVAEKIHHLVRWYPRAFAKLEALSLQG